MTQKNNDPIHKRIADFTESELKGTTFVGISSDKEVFLSFQELTPEEELESKVLVKDRFGDEVSTIATVVSVSMEEVTQLVDGLNSALEEIEEEEKNKKPNLLDIGSF